MDGPAGIQGCQAAYENQQIEEQDMIELRPLASLGGDRMGWLDTKHHFSFANYHDPERMHWGNLRVWNDDEAMPCRSAPTPGWWAPR